MQDALHIGCSLLGGYEGHTPKSCCLSTTLHTSLSRGNLKKILWG